MLSDAKIQANRANAQKSTGPRTAEGKQNSARNATSHGFFCRDAVLPGEDFDEFIDLREHFIEDLRPQNYIELRLVDNIALANWKLRRLQTSELHLHNSKEDQLKSTAKAYVERLREDSRMRRANMHVTDKLIEAAKEEMDASVSMAASLATLDGRSFERLAMLEIRLQNQINRNLRELSRLRKERGEIEDQPPSPFSRRRMETFDERFEEFCRSTQSKTGYRPPPFRVAGENHVQKCPETARNGTVWHAEKRNAQNEPNSQRPLDAQTKTDTPRDVSV